MHPFWQLSLRSVPPGDQSVAETRAFSPVNGIKRHAMVLTSDMPWVGTLVFQGTIPPKVRILEADSSRSGLIGQRVRVSVHPGIQEAYAGFRARNGVTGMWQVGQFCLRSTGFSSRPVDSPKNLSRFENLDCDSSKMCIDATSHTLKAPTSSRKNGWWRIRYRQDPKSSISKKRFVFNYSPLFPPKNCMTTARAVEPEAHFQKLRTPRRNDKSAAIRTSS